MELPILSNRSAPEGDFIDRREVTKRSLVSDQDKCCSSSIRRAKERPTFVCFHREFPPLFPFVVRTLVPRNFIFRQFKDMLKNVLGLIIGHVR